MPECDAREGPEGAPGPLSYEPCAHECQGHSEIVTRIDKVLLLKSCLYLLLEPRKEDGERTGDSMEESLGPGIEAVALIAIGCGWHGEAKGSYTVSQSYVV